MEVYNINRDYLVSVNLKNAQVTSPSMYFYNTDKGIANIFVKLQVAMSEDLDIKQYVNMESASNYRVKLIVIKPKTNSIVELNGVVMNPSVDGNNAIYLFDMPSNFTDQVGSYKCELEITCDVGDITDVVTSNPFLYEVKPSVVTGLNKELEANPDLPILKQLIGTVSDYKELIPIVDDEHPGKLTTYSSLKIDSFQNEVSEQFNTKASKVELQVERERINLLSKIENGETEGNAELLDIRVGANGKTYSTAGEMVRSISRGENLVNSSIGSNKLDFLELDEKINLFDGNYILGSLPGDDQISLRFEPSNDENKKTLVIKIKPNTEYTIVKENSIIFKVATDITDINEVDLTKEYTLKGSIRKHISSGNTFTFTTGENDKILFVYVSSIGETPFLQILEGTRKTFITNKYPLYIKGNKDRFENIEMLTFKNLLSTSLMTYDYDKKVTFEFLDRVLTSDGEIVIVNNKNKKLRNYLLPKLNFKFKDYDVVYLNVEELETLESRNIPIDMVHKSTFYAINGESNVYFDNEKYIPLFWYGYGRLNTSLGIEVKEYTPSENRKIKVIKNKEQIDIYVPSKKSSNYVHYIYKRVIDSSINYDSWRLWEIYVSDSKFNNLYYLGQTEWEGAISEKNAIDFIGGYHGDERNVELSILVDGEVVAIDTDINKEVSEIKIVNKSILNRCNYSAVDVFTRYRVNTWTSENFTIENKYISLIDFTINQSKIAMASVYKQNNGINILSSGRNDYNYEVTDIKNDFSDTELAKPKKDIYTQEMWGNDSKFYISVTCEFDRNKYSNSNAYIEDFGERAKIYFDVTGEYIMKKGEELKVKSIINIKC